ncbi:MAG: toll/interleukin-1 receptor domain-containing protein [Sphaerochaeta sp.]
MSIFISYSHANSDIVEKIAANLVAKNIHIWIDKWQLNFGDSLIQRIQEGITECSALLLVLSKDYLESEWCTKEQEAALLRELEEKKVIAIPILLEDCEIPIFLRGKYYADFRGDFNKAIHALQDSLLRRTDITLNRAQNLEFFIDWAVNEGFDNNQNYFFNVDSVSFSKKLEFSILCSIKTTGNKSMTELYKTAAIGKQGYYFFNEMLESLLSLDTKYTLREFLPDSNPIVKNFILQDPNLEYKFDVEVYIRRLGINNGFDQIFDYGSILRLIGDQRRLIMSH